MSDMTMKSAHAPSAATTTFHRNVSRLKTFTILVLSVWNLTLLHVLHQTTYTSPTKTTSFDIALQSLPGSPRTSSYAANTTSDANNSVAVRRDHPHAGARDEKGQWGYVPDVTAIRRRAMQHLADEGVSPLAYLPLPFDSTVCQVPPGQGFEGSSGYKVLHDFVEVDGPDPIPEAKLERAREPRWPEILNPRKGHLSWMKHAPNPRENVTAPRILCGVYTYAGHHDQVADLADTWGWRCDGFFAASTRTDRSIGAVDLPHKGKERYDNMWQKTRSMVAFMYDHYLDDYDYFLLCGDDTYVIVENLRNYLMLLEATTGGRESAQPLYIGAPIHFHGVNYNTGGSAYLLNTVALRRLVELALPHYFPQTACSAEDVFMGIIMSALSIPLVDTSDAHHRQRFFHDNFTSVGSDQGIDMYGHYVYKHHHDDNHRRTGRDLVSTQSVGFHRVTSMKRFHAILYKTCPSGTVLGDAMLQTM